MADAVGGFPVFLESVHTDISRRRHVGMEDLSCKPALWWGCREFLRKLESNSEVPAGIWCALWTLDEPRHIEHIILVGYYPNALWGTVLELIKLTH